MTILSCQKRHHEPHVIEWFGVFGEEITRRDCDGRARWPYDRPKPPRIHDHDRSIPYALEHDVIVIFKDVYRPLWTAYMPGDNGYSQFFTHTEAINYAQKLAQERSKQRGNS